MCSKTLLISALGFVLAAGSAFASAGDDMREEYYELRGPMPFEVMDLNGDGVVTAEEHRRVRNERHCYRAEQGYLMRRASETSNFEAIDRDRDGSINRNELSEWQVQRMQRRSKGW